MQGISEISADLLEYQLLISMTSGARGVHNDFAPDWGELVITITRFCRASSFAISVI